jgi:hypothetical protein
VSAEGFMVSLRGFPIHMITHGFGGVVSLTFAGIPIARTGEVGRVTMLFCRIEDVGEAAGGLGGGRVVVHDQWRVQQLITSIKLSALETASLSQQRLPRGRRETTLLGRIQLGERGDGSVDAEVLAWSGRRVWSWELGVEGLGVEVMLVRGWRLSGGE